MNLFINVYLVPTPLGGYNPRGALPSFDKIDIFKFMLNSLAVIPYWDEIHIYCKLDEVYKSRQSELQKYIEKYFNKYKLNLQWYRNEHQQDYQKTIQPCIDNGQPTLFFNNHDHIFIGKISYIDDILAELNNNSEYKRRQVYISHWLELIAGFYFHQDVDRPEHDAYKSNKRYSKFKSCIYPTRDGIQILNTNTLINWFFESNHKDAHLGRMDGKIDRSIDNTSECLLYNKEIFRHFDGQPATYPHMAMSIPPGLLDNNEKVVKYGYNDIFHEYVNINPFKNYRDLDYQNGADYLHCLKDLPDIFKFNNYQIDISDAAINQEHMFEKCRNSKIRELVKFAAHKVNKENGFHQEITEDYLDEISNI